MKQKFMKLTLIASGKVLEDLISWDMNRNKLKKAEKELTKILKTPVFITYDESIVDIHFDNSNLSFRDAVKAISKQYDVSGWELDSGSIMLESMEDYYPITENLDIWFGDGPKTKRTDFNSSAFDLDPKNHGCIRAEFPTL